MREHTVAVASFCSISELNLHKAKPKYSLNNLGTGTLESVTDVCRDDSLPFTFQIIGNEN